MNLSVWETAEALFAFTYQGPHVGVYRTRGEGFERPAQSGLALWWVPARSIPTVEDAKERLEHLRRPDGRLLAFKSWA